jgi:hypothetical protein
MIENPENKKASNALAILPEKEKKKSSVYLNTFPSIMTKLNRI